MNTLTSQIEQLQSLAHELLYLGVDGAPIYTDHFRQLNKEVLEQSDALYPQRGATPGSKHLSGIIDGLQCNHL